jgi:hypothetical protein
VDSITGGATMQGYFIFIFIFIFFEAGFHYVDWAGLKLTMWPRPVSNSWFSCLCSPNTGNRGVSHHTPLKYYLKIKTKCLFCSYSEPSIVWCYEPSIRVMCSVFSGSLRSTTELYTVTIPSHVSLLCSCNGAGPN